MKEFESRLHKANTMLKLANELGDYDGNPRGQHAEIYAEEVYGMVKATKGLEAVDGWIGDEAVQVKSTLGSTARCPSDIFVPGIKADKIQRLIVLVHFDHKFIVVNKPINEIVVGKGNVVYLHQFDEVVAAYKEHKLLTKETL